MSSKTKKQLQPMSQRKSERDPAASPKWRTLLLGVALVVATVALYYPVNTHPFINYDDPEYVTQNVQVQSGLNWDTVKWAFTTYKFANWHPLTWLSHALDCELFQLDPAGHHETSMWLHAFNALLLFWVLWRATGATGPSLMVAALFALHPINVESVAWISERKNLLSAMFFLLALGAYRWYACKPRVNRYVVVAVLFACGLMSKSQIVTFPFVLLLWDYWPLGRMFSGRTEEPAAPSDEAIPAKSFSWLILEKLPLFVMCAASALVTIQAAHAEGGTTGNVWHPLIVRIGNAIVSYGRYIGKAFWPSNLALYYPYAEESPGRVVAVAALLLAITALVIVERRRRRYLLVGWFWFLGMLIPVIGLVQVAIQSMADRYAYLSFVGLFIAVCWSVAELARQHKVPVPWLATASVAVLLALAVVSHRQIGFWEDSVSVWTHAVRVTDNNYIAEGNLGGAFVAEGEIEAAMPHFYKALAINPDDPESNLDVGSYRQQQRDLPQAIAQYKKVLSVTQNAIVLNRTIRAKALNNLGYCYRDLGDLAQARESFEGAVAVDPQYARAWLGLGLVEQKSGDVESAVRAFSQAMKLQPSDVGYLLLARALERRGDNNAALTATQQAKVLSRNVDNAQRIADQMLAQ